MSKKKNIIEISSDISKYNIDNIYNKEEVEKKVIKYLENKFLSDNTISKPIKNLDSGMLIEIWRKGIRETFGNDRYYMKLPKNIKIAKIASMDSLAKLIKYAKVKVKNIPNYHSSRSKVKFMYLENYAKIDNQEYLVTIDIRMTPKGKNKFYIHNLKIKKREAYQNH